MARTIEPERWEKFAELLQRGHGIGDAARRAGISRSAASRFLHDDPRSTGHQWLAWRRAIRTGLIDECPTCGRSTKRDRAQN